MLTFFRRVRVVAAAAAALICCVSIPALSQNIVVIGPVSGHVQVTPGSTFSVPFVIDMSAAGGLNINNLNLDAAFTQTRINFDSLTGGNFYSDYTGGSFGNPLTVFGAGVPVTSNILWVTAWFTAAGSNGGTRIALTPTFMSDLSSANILPAARVKNLDVCIAPNGTWGDGNGDNAVNIIDAQQLARFAVGLSVANPTVLGAQGDVNNDATINIIDAQQVARYSVGLSAVPRVNTSVFSPTVATLTITSILDAAGGGQNVGVPANLSGMLAGNQAQVIPSAHDAVGADVTPCSNLVFASTNPAVASVSASGLITAVGAGTATISVTSNGHTAQSNVVVTSPYTTISWTNAAGGSWNLASNWSLNRVPQAGDSVVIALPGTYTVTVNSNAAASFIAIGGASGTATLNDPGSNITLNGGIIVKATGNLTTNTGTIGGNGTLTNSGAVTLQGGTVNLAINNQGTLVQRSGTSFGGQINNAVGAMFRIQGDIGCCAASSNVANLMSNSGTIELTSIGNNSATLSISSPSTLTNTSTGVISVLGPGGSRTLSGLTVNLGTIDVNSVDLTLAQLVSNQAGGTVTIGSGRTLNINSGGALAYAGGTVSGAGTIAVNTSGAIVTSVNTTFGVPTITVNSGSIAGTGTFTVPLTQTLTIIAGAISAPMDIQGTAIVRSSTAFISTVNVGGSGFFRVLGDPNCCAGLATVTGAFTNTGVIELSSINGSNAATLQMSGATLTNNSGGIITTLAGTGGTRSLIGPLVNLGTINVLSADLSVSQTLTNGATGLITASAGRTLTMTSGSTLNQSGGSITGNGTIAFASATLAMNTSAAPSIATITALNSNINGAATLTVPNGTTFTANTTTVSAGFVNQGLAIVQGSSSFTGAVSFTNGSTFRILGDPNCCAGNATFSTNFTNNGTIELSSINGSNSAVLTVNNGITLTNGPTGVITPLAGTGGTRTITGTISNQGLINLNFGADLSQSRGLTNTGTINIAAGRTFSIGTPGGFTHTSGSITGSGTFSVTGTTAVFTNALATSPAITLLFSGTTLSGAGSLLVPSGQTVTLSSSSVVNVALANSGIIEVRSTIPFNAAFTNSSGSVLRIQGDASCCAGVATFANGFTNNGDIELTSINGSNSATMNVTTGSLANSASGRILPLAGLGGLRTLNASTNNSGLIDVSGGADMTIGAISNNGTVSVGAGRTLTQTGATPFITGTGTLTGAGTYSGNTTTFTLSSSFTPTIAFINLTNPTISGNGTTLTIPVGTQATVTGALGTIQPALAIQGTFISQLTNTLGSAPAVTAGGLLRIQGSGFGAANLVVPTAFSNSGTIDLTSTGGSTNATLTMTGGAQLTNVGTVNVVFSGTGLRTLNGALRNQNSLNLSGVAGTLSISGLFFMTSASNINMALFGSPLGASAINAAGLVTINGAIHFNCTNISLNQQVNILTTTTSMSGAFNNGITSTGYSGGTGVFSIVTPTANVIAAKAQ